MPSCPCTHSATTEGTPPKGPTPPVQWLQSRYTADKRTQNSQDAPTTHLKEKTLCPTTTPTFTSYIMTIAPTDSELLGPLTKAWETTTWVLINSTTKPIPPRKEKGPAKSHPVQPKRKKPTDISFLRKPGNDEQSAGRQDEQSRLHPRLIIQFSTPKRNGFTR